MSYGSLDTLSGGLVTVEAYEAFGGRVMLGFSGLAERSDNLRGSDRSLSKLMARLHFSFGPEIHNSIDGNWALPRNVILTTIVASCTCRHVTCVRLIRAHAADVARRRGASTMSTDQSLAGAAAFMPPCKLSK